jgi:hypothetical protein
MIRGIIPYSEIDTDARWGFARTKGWVLGYKLHLCCSIGLPVPLFADFTAANVDDTKAYCNLVEPLSGVQYVVADRDMMITNYTNMPIRREQDLSVPYEGTGTHKVTD